MREPTVPKRSPRITTDEFLNPMSCLSRARGNTRSCARPRHLPRSSGRVKGLTIPGRTADRGSRLESRPPGCDSAAPSFAALVTLVQALSGALSSTKLSQFGSTVGRRRAVVNPRLPIAAHARLAGAVPRLKSVVVANHSSERGVMPKEHLRHRRVIYPSQTGGCVDLGRVVDGKEAITLQAPRRH
jgi:hypothetical protein